jgi:hypothetical protein
MAENEFFIGLPDGKETGFCQTDPGASEELVVIREMY